MNPARLSLKLSSQIRMTNDDIRRNNEFLMTKAANAPLRGFRHSGFGFLSSFVIRHSTTCAIRVHGPNTCGKTKGASPLPLCRKRSRARVSFFAVGLFVSATLSPAAEPSALPPEQSTWADFVETDFPFFSSVLDARKLGHELPAD